MMRSKAIFAIFGLALLMAMPAASYAAPATHGLDAAFWNQSFFGSTLATWPSCTTETAPPAGTPSLTPPTATETDPNIAHGASVNFYWDESANGGGFMVGGTSFVNTDFSVEWTGYIALAAGTTYYFQLTSDDGSWLYINTTPGSSTISGTNLILNDANPTNSNHLGDGIQPPTPATSEAVTVSQSGNYPIEVDYYETCDTQSGIDLSWSTTSATSGFSVIPTTAFSPAAIGSNANIDFYPPSTVPEFPVGLVAVLAVALPALLFLKKSAK
jgi:hypothetical protein